MFALAHTASGIFNLAIVGGYVFAAFYIGPRVQGTRFFTQVAGAIFFLTCGLHHFENVLHLTFEEDGLIGDMLTSSHMLVIDGVQAVAIWAFILGLATDFIVKPIPEPLEEDK